MKEKRSEELVLQRVPSRCINGKNTNQKLASKSIGAPASGDSPVILRFIDVSRKILSCLISSITICILSLLSMSTSGRPPALSATRRFWMSVDSLKRPPTLFTISSSRRSSIMSRLLSVRLTKRVWVIGRKLFLLSRLRNQQL